MQKLKLRSRRTNGNILTTPHGALVQEALAVTRKLDSLRSFPANKLTAQAFLEETLSADPSATMKGVKKLRAALEQKPVPPSLAQTARSLYQMTLALRGPNWSTTPPVKFPWRLNQFGSPETTAELIRFGGSIVELFCVAIQLVEERSPDVWGVSESSAKHASHVAELESRQAELFKQLETSVSGEDLLIPDDPHVPTAFRIAPTVPLAPRQDAGKRLVAYLMAQREQPS